MISDERTNVLTAVYGIGLVDIEKEQSIEESLDLLMMYGLKCSFLPDLAENSWLCFESGCSYSFAFGDVATEDAVSHVFLKDTQVLLVVLFEADCTQLGMQEVGAFLGGLRGIPTGVDQGRPLPVQRWSTQVCVAEQRTEASRQGVDTASRQGVLDTLYSRGGLVKVNGGSITVDPDGQLRSRGRSRTVQVSHDFLIGRTEVTQAQYEAVMGTNPSHFVGNALPVDSVSWDDASTFCVRLTAQSVAAGVLAEGCVYRLPTVAEWEYAARGGSRSRGFRYSGSDICIDVAWCEDSSGGKTHPVGTREPNELGLFDMSGNLAEWCVDRGELLVGDGLPTELRKGDAYRQIQGGSWASMRKWCRLDRYSASLQSAREARVGFRVVRTVK
jgi:formylglycine-generating enzyme required for sulfatase activity